MKSRWIILMIPGWVVGITLLSGAAQDEPVTPTEETTQVDSKPPVKKPTTEIPRAGCVTSECHADVKDYAFLHGPMFVNACDACHTLTSAVDHTFELIRTPENLCSFCHTLDLSDAEYLHEPVTKGDCLSCHDPHGSSDPALLKGKSYADTCHNCHEKQWKSLESVHGPVAAGACGACHEAHGSKYPNLLEQQGSKLCLQCHISTAKSIDAAHFVHGPIKDDCQVCHDSHASTHDLLLNEDPVQLCESCHENIRMTVDSATTKHAAVTTEQACLNCHTAHASDYPNMLKANPKTLCFECHDKEIIAADGTALPNMKALIDSGMTLHGPTSQDSCVECHEIHGGGNDRLLIKEYPSNLYYPFSEKTYALCFSCHDRNLVLLAETTAVTNFRNGESNLHYVHVKKDKRGRSCRVCHDTHARAGDHGIRKSVVYGSGGWLLQIDFQATATGGSCAPGCHGAYAYDRVTPVQNIKPKAPPDYKENIIKNGGAKVPGKPEAPKGNGDGR